MDHICCLCPSVSIQTLNTLRQDLVGKLEKSSRELKEIWNDDREPRNRNLENLSEQHLVAALAQATAKFVGNVAAPPACRDVNA